MSVLVCALVLAQVTSAPVSAALETPFATAIRSATPRVVKLYGASIGREQGYGSGILISSDGRIVTTLSILLESPSIRVVLSDGRRFAGRVVARDARRQLAEIRIDANALPYFELGDSTHLEPGDWIISAANPFKVAVGPEPVSFMAGVFSGRAALAARRRAQDFAYTGQVLLTDIIVATPGSAGGALVDIRGRLVGLIGKAVIDTRTNTWANYGLPVEEIAAFVNHGDEDPRQTADADSPSASALPRLGLRLFDVGGRVRPAYVERVQPGSAARRAGIRSGDLILSVAGTPVASCEEFDEAMRELHSNQSIEVVVKRGEKVLSMPLTVEGGE